MVMTLVGGLHQCLCMVSGADRLAGSMHYIVLMFDPTRPRPALFICPPCYCVTRARMDSTRPHVKTRSIARPNVGYEHFVMKEEEHHEERSGSDRRDKDSRKARHN